MIKPKWAISVWCDTDNIYLDLGGYTVQVQHSPEGIQKLLHLLRAREEDARFSTEGCPTQDQINHVFYGLKRKAKKRPRLDLSMDEYKSGVDILKSMGLVK